MVTHIYTSIATNYLAKARVLAESIRRVYPEAVFHLLLADRVPDWLDLQTEPFDHLITLDDLPIPNRQAWLFSHDLVELSTAVKGLALQHILARSDADRVLYFDPDIVVLASLDGLLRHFDDASILLTPHLTEPERDQSAVVDNELSALRHGTYNFGFLGVKNDAAGRRFAGWWTDRLLHFGYDDIPNGLFTDQRWADLVPAFFPEACILRDPTFNVATWNLTHRHVAGSLESGLTVEGQPLVFYHFSGLDSGSQAGMLQRYGSHMPVLFVLRDWYLAECERHGDAQLSSVPWAYGFFADGTPILRAQRRRYRQSPQLQTSYPDPFTHFDRAAPAVPSAPTDQIAPYRIFLIAAPADQSYLAGTLDVLRQTTVNWDHLWLVTDQTKADDATRDLPALIVDGQRYEDFAAHILQTFADQDILLLRAGAVTPDRWDLRLAWAAARNPNALTLSPFDRRFLTSALDLAELDRRCYFFRDNDEDEINYLLEGCLFVRAQGLGELPAPVRLSMLLGEAARRRWQHLRTSHLCVAFRCPPGLGATPRVERALIDRLRAHCPDQPRTLKAATTVATLHMTHDWGGGVEHWINNYAGADPGHDNLVLRSRAGNLELFRYGSGTPARLQSWRISPRIRATAIDHPLYSQVLAAIVNEFHVGRIIVSSLIGHSLEALRTGLPTTFVCHDYYPFCSAVNITFGETCRSCEPSRLDACLRENPLNRFFPNVVRNEWLALRAAFSAALLDRHVTMVGPSQSVLTNYGHLAPELAPLFRLIPHGMREFHRQPPGPAPAQRGKLRVLLLGHLVKHKGLPLFQAMVDELLSFADITLAGNSEASHPASAYPQIRVIPEYRPEDLPGLVTGVQPDISLFLSQWPETFGYTLHEMQMLCVPPVATRLGAYSDAIEEGVTGFLCDPDPQSILKRLRELAASPERLLAVREHLSRQPRRSVEAMVADYAALVPDAFSAARYFSGPQVPPPLPNRTLQLFWCGDRQSFLEDNSFRFQFYRPDRQTARLYFPAVAGGIAKLRLDLGSAAGVCSLYRFRVLREDGTAVWSAGNASELLACSVAFGVYPLNETDLCLVGNDPHLTLNMPPATFAATNAGGSIEVELAWSSIESHVDDLVEAGFAPGTSGAESLRTHLDLSRNHIENLEEVNAKLRHDLTDTLAELTRLQNLRDENLQLARDHAENLRRMNEALQNSIFWRATKPVRLAVKLGRKLSGR